MQKMKWFRVSTDSPFREVVGFFEKKSYSDASKYGFDVIDVCSSRALVKYTEKNIFKELITLPSGEQESINFDRYITFYFEFIEIDLDTFFIKIIEPPRSLKNFIKRISEAGSKQLYFSNLVIDINIFINSIVEKYSINRLLISKAVIDKVAISGSSQARLEITSSQNAYQDFIKKFGGRDHLLLKVVSCFVMGGSLTKIEVARSGILSIDDSVTEIDTIALAKLIYSAS